MPKQNCFSSIERKSRSKIFESFYPVGQAQSRDAQHSRVWSDDVQETKHVQQMKKIDKIFKGVVKERIFGSIISKKSTLSKDQHTHLNKLNKTVTLSNSQKTQPIANATGFFFTNNPKYSKTPRARANSILDTDHLNNGQKGRKLSKNYHKMQSQNQQLLCATNRQTQHQMLKTKMGLSQRRPTQKNKLSPVGPMSIDPLRKSITKYRGRSIDSNKLHALQLRSKDLQQHANSPSIKGLKSPQSTFMVEEGHSPEYIRIRNNTTHNYAKFPDSLALSSPTSNQLSGNQTPLASSPSKLYAKRLKKKQSKLTVRLKQMHLLINTPDGDVFAEHFKSQLSAIPNVFLFDIRITRQTLLSRARSCRIDSKLVEHFLDFFGVPGQTISYRQLKRAIQKAFSSPVWIVYFFIFQVLDQSNNGFLTISDLFRLIKNYPQCTYIEPEIFLLRDKLSQIEQHWKHKSDKDRKAQLHLEDMIVVNKKLKADDVFDLLKKSAKLKLNRVGQGLKITCYNQTFISLEHDANSRHKQEQIQSQKLYSSQYNNQTGSSYNDSRETPTKKAIQSQKAPQTSNQEATNKQELDSYDCLEKEDKILEQDGIRLRHFEQIFKGRRPKLMCVLVLFLTGLRKQDYQ